MSLTLEDILTLPKVNLFDKRNAPQISCVYFFVYRQEVVYVGSTVSLRSRLQSHEIAKRLKPDANNVYLYWLELNAKEIRMWELEFIEIFKPRLNKIMSDGKKRKDLVEEVVVTNTTKALSVFDEMDAAVARLPFMQDFFRWQKENPPELITETEMLHRLKDYDPELVISLWRRVGWHPEKHNNMYQVTSISAIDFLAKEKLKNQSS